MGDRHWQRAKKTPFDHDPIYSDTSLPNGVPLKTEAGAVLIGFSQAGDSEYRGVLADTGVEPANILRFKYYEGGAWDGAGRDKAIDNYLAGLHRRAFGNTLWVAQFSSPSEAAKAAPKIAKAAFLHPSGALWIGKQPSISGASGGPMTLWTEQQWVMISTVSSIGGPTP